MDLKLDGDTVAPLASDLSCFTTGTIITVDGGASARFALLSGKT